MIHTTDTKRAFAPGTPSAKTGNLNLTQLHDNNFLKQFGKFYSLLPYTVQKCNREGKVSEDLLSNYRCQAASCLLETTKFLSGIGGADKPKRRQEKIRMDGNKLKGMAMLCERPWFKDLLSSVICFAFSLRSFHYETELPLRFSTHSESFGFTSLQSKWKQMFTQPPGLKCSDTTSSNYSFPPSLWVTV